MDVLIIKKILKNKGRPRIYTTEDKELRKIYNSKVGLKKNSFDIFKEWYIKQNNCCAYCSLTTEQSLVLFNKYPNATRGGRRGKRLEIDRIDPKIKDYGADINNLVLACYWCNNAKTNYFTYDEFKIIGKSFSEIQKNRLA